MSKVSELLKKLLGLFKRKKETAEAEIDASTEVLDKSGDGDEAEIVSKKKTGGAFGRIKQKFRIRLKLRKSAKSDAESDSDDEGENGNEEEAEAVSKAKKVKKKAPKVMRKKRRKPVKRKRTGKNKKTKPIVLISIISGGLLTGLAVFLIVLFVNRPTVEQQLLEAQLLLSEQKYDEAADVYQKLIKKDDKLSEAYIGLADTMVGKNDTDGALKELTDALVPTSDDAKIKAKIEELTSASDVSPPQPGTEPIVFKDEAFARLLRQAMGKQPEEPVSEADLADITTLKILGDTHSVVDESLEALNKNDGYIIGGVKYTEYGTIKSLADLSHFSKLRKLTIAYNSVEDISGLENLTGLETLGLYFNNIQNISALSKLTNLKYLYIYNNQITDISPLSSLVKLEQLWLSKNQISDISPLKSCPNLEELFFSDNAVTDISAVSQLSKLCFLFAERNNISDISALKDMQSLTDVSFVGNPVGDLSPVSHVNNVNKPYSS